MTEGKTPSKVQGTAANNLHVANKSETSDQQKAANVLIGLQDQSESHILNPSLEDDSDSDSSLEAYN